MCGARTSAIWYCHSPRPHLAIWWLQRPTAYGLRYVPGQKPASLRHRRPFRNKTTPHPPMPAAASRATRETDASRRDVTPSNIPDHVPISPPPRTPPPRFRFQDCRFLVSCHALDAPLRGECAAGEGRACLGVVSLATTSYGRRSPRPVTEHGDALFRRREVEEYPPPSTVVCSTSTARDARWYSIRGTFPGSIPAVKRE